MVDSAAEGELEVRVSPYVFNEVYHRLRNPKGRYHSEDIQEATERFTDVVVHSKSVHAPSQQEVEDLDVGEQMRKPASRLVSALLDIQSKDAPVLIDAWGCDRRADIYTCDREFATCDLSEFGIGHLQIHHVNPP
nr:hypothetical protein [Halorubrum tebenquichense]